MLLETLEQVCCGKCGEITVLAMDVNGPSAISSGALIIGPTPPVRQSGTLTRVFRHQDCKAHVRVDYLTLH
jgi:hypothetical protein